MSEAPAAPADPLASPGPWNLVADDYDGITRPFLEQFARSGLARLGYGPQTRAVDVACGPGTTALLVAPAVRHVACVDFSAAMLDRIRRNAAAAGATNLDIVEGDGQALPFPDGGFDLAVSMFGLMFFPDRAKGFAELHRVLAPGGSALVSSWAPMDRSPLVTAVVAALQPEDAAPPPPRGMAGLENPALFEKEMHAAGFVDIRVEAVEHGMPVRSVETFWDEFVRATAPVALLKGGMPAEEWAATERRALRRLAARFDGRLPTTLSSTAWIATARKR